MTKLAPAPSRLHPPAPGIDVLIAESNPAARQDLHRFLTDCGHAVETAAGGVECLGKLRRRSDAVLVLDRDLAWGGCDGVLAVLRDDPTLAHVPVLLTAAAAEEPAAPVVGVLVKPYPPDALLAGIRAGVSHGDQCLKARIERKLAATGHRCLGAVGVGVRGRRVTLRGHVPTYHLKQIAQAVTRSVPGVRGLHNEMTVHRND